MSIGIESLFSLSLTSKIKGSRGGRAGSWSPDGHSTTPFHEADGEPRRITYMATSVYPYFADCLQKLLQFFSLCSRLCNMTLQVLPSRNRVYSLLCESRGNLGPCSMVCQFGAQDSRGLNYFCSLLLSSSALWKWSCSVVCDSLQPHGL